MHRVFRYIHVSELKREILPTWHIWQCPETFLAVVNGVPGAPASSRQEPGIPLNILQGTG